jgi:hypothetical protein
MAQLELFPVSQTYTARNAAQIGQRVGHGELFPEFAGASLMTVDRQEVATVAHAVTVAVSVAKVEAKTEARKARKAKAQTKAEAEKAEAEAEADAVKAPADPWANLPAYPIDREKGERQTVAVRAYLAAYEAEKAGNRAESARQFATVVEVCAPELRFAAVTGSIQRRALGIEAPSQNLLKYSSGKSEAEHFAQSRGEREMGRGVYIGEHMRPTGGTADAFAAADAGFSRAFEKLCEYVAKGHELPHCKQVITNPECRDSHLAAFITGTAARVYREEVYGRHRANGKTKASRKPCTLGDHDPIDYRHDIGSYLLDIDSRKQIISEFSHALSGERLEEERDTMTGTRLDPLRMVYGFAACYGGARAGRPKAGEVISEVKPHHIMGVSRATANRLIGKGGTITRHIMGHMLRSIEDLNIIGRRLEMVRLTYRFCTLLNTLHRIKDRA